MRKKNIFSLILILAGAGAMSCADEIKPPIAAAEIMRRVRDNLPQAPVRIHGQLRSGPLRGGFDYSCRVEIHLDMGRNPMTADYILRDQFGGILERMLVLRHGAASVDLRYARGNDAAAAEPPPPHENIQATDFTWDDLTMAFLWWPEARLDGRDTFRGRDCAVLELTPPGAAQAGEFRRLWVDEKMGMFLQMEVWRDGLAVRRLMARSFKKIRGQWMIKDMEMRSPGQSHRTLLRVEDVISPDTGGDGDQGMAQ